jgi:hypothetical protein
MSLPRSADVTPTREVTRRDVRVLFVVSRERPDRYDSLARAFSGDGDVRVIFDRRRVDRRRDARPPATERRRGDRRSALSQWVVQTMGWIRVPVADALLATARPSRPSAIPRQA